MIFRLTIGLLLFNMLMPLHGQQHDSLLLQKEMAPKNEKIKLLHELVLANWLNYPQKAQEYAKESIDLSLELEDSTNISKSLRLMAGVYYYKGEFEMALNFNRQALAIALELQNDELINNCYNNIGLLYYTLGSYPQALEYLLLSIEIKDRIGAVYGKATSLNNVGLIYEKNQQYDEARTYFTQALELARSLNDDNLIVYSLHNIGLTWLREKQLETAQIYFENGSTIAERINNIFWGSGCLRGLGEISQAVGKYDEALNYFNKALDASKSIEDKQGIADSYTLLSKYHLEKQQYNHSLQMLDSSQHFANLIKSVHLIQTNLKLYITINEKRNNKTAVIIHQQQYINFQDSLFQKTVNRNLELVPTKIEENARRSKIELQLNEIQQHQFEDRVYLIILLFSIPLIAVLILLLSKIRTSNLDLRKKNAEIEAQSFEIEGQNLKLNLSIRQLRRTQNLLTESEKMATIGQLVGGLAHELNNPLNFIGGIIRPMHMNLKDLESYSDEIKDSESYQDMLMLLKGVEEGTDRASGIIDKLKALSPKLRTQEKERFDFADCVEETLELLEKDYDKINFINNLVVGPMIITSNYYEVTKILFAIINNAVQAVLKNVANDRSIYIEAFLSEEKLQVVVQDNGPGMDQRELKKIYTPFYTTKSELDASGLGLFIAQLLVERNRGQITAESTKGQGTTFTIILPV